MSKPMIRIHNTETDEILDREMTDDEFESHQALIKKIELENELKTQKEEKRAAALNKLEALGLTTEDLKALGL